MKKILSMSEFVNNLLKLGVMVISLGVVCIIVVKVLIWFWSWL